MNEEERLRLVDELIIDYLNMAQSLVILKVLPAQYRRHDKHDLPDILQQLVSMQIKAERLLGYK